MRLALTREISPAIVRCELTHLLRLPIDLARAELQHRAYEARLAAAGCRVERIAAGLDMPDSVFIEDTAVVFDELAVITRPGAISRRAETLAVAAALRVHRTLHAIEAPGTLDGGDVLVMDRRVFVGRSARTNAAGIEQLRRILSHYGYALSAVEVRGCLHLKSAVTAVGDDVVLLNPRWLPEGPFADFDRVDVHPDEPLAANALRIDDRVIYPTAFPRTRGRLERHGVNVVAVDASEVAKAEGALTCCSLVFVESR